MSSVGDFSPSVRHWRSRVANISHLVRETQKLPRFCFLPSWLPLPSSQSSAQHLGCARGAASVPESSVLCVLSLHLMGFRKTLPLQWGNISQSWVSAALFSCGSAELVELWVPEDFTSKHFKKPNCFGSNGTEVSPYMLGCCLLLTSTALLCAKSIQVRKAGVGAASSASGNGLHLLWTCSFCFMSWKQENCIFGQRISKQSYKGCFFKGKKRCKIKCMFTCPRSKVLNTKVTLSWMDPPLSSGSGTSCPFSLLPFYCNSLFFSPRRNICTKIISN